jgi:hypothetical protein
MTPLPQPTSGRLGPGISSNRATPLDRSNDAGRDSRQCLAPQPRRHGRQPACRRIPAAQPSGLRGQALPRPRFRIVAMAEPVRGRGDARPPCACRLEGPAGHRSRRADDWGQALPRPRFKAIAMVAPVRGRGDARPPCACRLEGPAGYRSRRADDWGLASFRIAPCFMSQRQRHPRFEAMPGTATPEATTSAAGRRIPAAQPSGSRGQALPRPRFKAVAMVAPVRGRGDARPPCACRLKGPAGYRSRRADDWGLASPRIAPCFMSQR